jgi:hypothetical protein
MITAELTYLTWISLFTALMWMPYTLNLISVRGLIAAISYPRPETPGTLGSANETSPC